MLLKDVTTGEKVLVYAPVAFGAEMCRLVAVAEVIGVDRRQCRIRNYGAFSLSTGNQFGGGEKFFRRAGAEELAKSQAKLDAEAEESERKSEAEKKAAYDALPEEVRLARKLEFFCNVNSEKTIARMPLDVLRAAVAWVEENNLERE